MRTFSKSGLMALMAIAPMALASTSLSAQEAQGRDNQMTQCTARVTGDQQIQAGEKATRVSLTLTSSVGNISDFTAHKGMSMDEAKPVDPTNPTENRPEAVQQDKGLKLADASDLPDTQREMAAGEQANRAIQMSNQNNTVTLWLNSEDAEAGTYQFTLEGTTGKCSGQLQVKESSYQR